MTESIQYIRPGVNNNEWLKMTDRDKEKNSHILKEILLSALQMQNIVVLAGSGASLGSGSGPSMKVLWEACTKKTDQYSSEAKEVCRLVGYDISDDNKVNIEELLSICESYLQIKIGNDPKKVEEFINHCKEMILKRCRFEKSSDFLEGHKNFIHRLSRRRIRDSRLKVFTTNYDTAFEEAASELGIVVIDGFSFAFPRQYDARFFDYDIVRRGLNKSTETDYLEGVFKLFKLHGSVNWEKRRNCIRENIHVESKNSCMIFPARGKYQQSYIQPHLELMARYLSALREPNTCLVIVGFGFNDDHLSEPILSAINSNPHLKIIVVNPNIQENINSTEETCSAYWKKLDDSRKKGEDIYFIEATFSVFSKLIPDLKALTPAEKLAQNIKQISGEAYES